MSKHRFGTFRVNTIAADRENIEEMLQQLEFTPTRISNHDMQMDIVFVGHSPLFKEIEEGEPPTRYTVWGSRHHITASTAFRVEEVVDEPNKEDFL
jgi:hypothetical protein